MRIASPAPAFDPEEFFKWASTTVQNSANTEAVLRSIVSRAYYSVLLTARDALFGGVDAPDLTRKMRDTLRQRYTRGMKTSRGPGSHDIILAAAAEAGLKSRMVVSQQQLTLLETSRVMADYYRVPSNYPQQYVQITSWLQCAQDSVALASNLLPSVKRLPRFRTVVNM